MKTNQIKSQLVTLLFASALAPFALTTAVSAPPAAPSTPVTGTVNATVTQTPLVTPAPTNPVSVTTTGSASVNAAGQPTVNPPAVDTSATTSTTVTGTTSSTVATPTVGANANLTTGTSVSTSGVAPTTPAAMALDSQATTQQIRANAYDSRNEVARNVESRLDSSRQFVSDAGSRAATMTADSQSQLQSALTVAREREIQVRASLRAVKTAAPENYEAARNQLAQDYDAYASAVAQVEASSSANTPR